MLGWSRGNEEASEGVFEFEIGYIFLSVRFGILN